MKTMESSLAGMCCLECATSVEHEVARLKGVKEARVDWKLKNITVKYDEKIIKNDLIESKIRDVIKRTENPF
jgi:copper chaperone CopZ